MILASVSYQRPASLAEAVQVLADHPGARVLAGGQSLVNILKLRAAHVDLLVDITRLEELRGITVGEDGTARIGAGVTYDELAHSEALRESHPIICEVAANTVDQQVRNRGTIGGNVCHADPINNFPPLVVALGATMHLVGPGGERTVPAEEFFTGFYTTAVEPGEILTAITVPPLPAGTGVGYVDIEIGEAAARAVAVVRSEDDRIADAVVVVGCLPAPARRQIGRAHV